MSVSHAKVENRVIDLLRAYTGKKHVLPSHMVNADLGLEGWESIDLLQDLEEEFELDLDPLVQSVTSYLPPSWWDRVLGRAHGARVADVKVRDLISYVIEHAGEGMNESIPRV